MEELILKLNTHFNGSPWYGESLISKLESIDFKNVNSKNELMPSSVAMLVKHIIAWRVYSIKKLEENITYSIEINSPDDWPPVSINSLEEWTSLLEELKQTQKDLIAILKLKNEEFLKSNVVGNKFNYEFLIEGMIQHDIYHQGQIALVSKLQEND